MSSVLLDMQKEAGAEFMPYGPLDQGIQIVQTFGMYEAEYAAIRKGVGILHVPQTGLVELRGKDRADFLHRMLTHDVRTLQPGQGRRAFLLGKTGRIQADMLVLHQAERTWLILDRFDAATLPKELESFLFSEDVTLIHRSSDWAHIALHGPAAAPLLEAAGAKDLASLEPLQHRTIALAGAEGLVWRLDQTGAPGLHLLIPQNSGAAILRLLAEAVGGLNPHVEGGLKRPLTGRGIGWLAFNTARIEAGWPLFHVDFGTDSLAHETGVLDQTVSFTKGCYLGQEIVARMQNLGHPKRMLVGLQMPDQRLPIAGSQVLDGDAQQVGSVVGALTSSTLSPMLGNIAIAFAVVKWSKHALGTQLQIPAEGQLVPATVHPLRFI